MSFTSWLRTLRARFGPSSARHARPDRRPRHVSSRPGLELLEDRTVPTAITVLGSHLRTAGGQPEYVRVAETGTGEGNGTDFTFDAAPGVYHLTDADGGGTYGSFNVANDGTISGTTGAAAATGSTSDFDLTKLAAVTVNGTDIKTAAGQQEAVNIQNFVGVDWRYGPFIVYFPACTVQQTLSGISFLLGKTQWLLGSLRRFPYDLCPLYLPP
jgi:hypothetical protein